MSPFRSRDELYLVMALFRATGSEIDVEDIRRTLVGFRATRESARLKVTQRLVSNKREKGKKARKRLEMLAKAEQMVRILRATNLVQSSGTKMTCTENGHALISLREKDQHKSDAFFLELLLNSHYDTYMRFLTKLFYDHEVAVPRTTTFQGPSQRTILFEKGYPVDVWSFFVMRDLFYEFSMLNFKNSGDNQIIFPVFLLENQRSPEFKYQIHVGNEVISYWPKMELHEFLQKIEEPYLRLADGHWNKIVEVIKLREAFSYGYHIPEREFNELFLRSLGTNGPIAVIPSFGSIRAESGSNYIIKAVSLPTNEMDLPYSLVRIEPRERS